MIRYLKLDLVVIGPVLSKGSEPGDPGLDAVALRAPDGSLVFNGKHIHGRCRHAAIELDRLASRKSLHDWAIKAFGPEGIDEEAKRGDGEWKPERARLSFEELHCVTSIARPFDARDYRLEKDEKTEAGNDRMLAVFERAGEHGAQLEFSGLVRVVCESENELEMYRDNLLRALRWLTNIGGEAGIGYGTIQKTSLQPCKTPAGVEGPPLEGVIPDSINLCLSFAEPFCLAEQQLDENIFRCLDWVPGNALAGAIQRAMDDVMLGAPDEEFPTLRNHFNRIRFRHAFPIQPNAKERPIPTPASWVYIKSEKTEGVPCKEVLYDVALIREPALFRLDGKDNDYLPNFAPDWKGGEKLAAKATGWGDVEKELRTYTEIEAETGVAKDKRLYAYELARPENTQWLGAMDMMAEIPADERSTLIEELRALLNQAPLLLGKTDARVSLSLSPNPTKDAPKPQPQDGRTDQWIVTLATQALLLDSTDLAGASQDSLKMAYEDAWNEIGNGLLTLEHYFTQETLIGSNYLHHRYRNAALPYYPYLVTEAGSVFVLSSNPGKQKEVQDLFLQLLRTGLSLNAWAIDKFKRDNKPGNYWSNCPFIPQNGFGEIVVNHPVQIALLPEKSGIEVKPIKTVVLQ